VKKRLVYIVSDIDKALAFEWLTDALKSKYDLQYILIAKENSQLEQFLKTKQIQYYRVDVPSRIPSLTTMWKVRSILRKINPDIVHTHLIKANFAGLIATWLLNVPKRIYTRHHSDYHHVYHPRAVILDRISNALSTHIIAITGIVRQILIEKESVDPKKITVINHGFDLSYFSRRSENVGALKIKYDLNNAKPVIGVVSRLTAWKGVQYIIPAFRKLLQKFPEAVLVMANAKGDYKESILQQLKEIPVERYRLIEFEQDIQALYQSFDMFVHVPISATSEAFGQTYVEALASGVPTICTLSGVAVDFIKHEKNALVVPYKDSDSILKAMIRLLEDQQLAAELIRAGKQDAENLFKLESMILRLEEVYEN
jgi:glycosyltransferase involved in cell wall biosynthesis